MKVRECVGCGHCCITARCWASLTLWEENSKECPALVWDREQSRYLCSLVIEQEQYKEPLHIGAGCCQGLNSWRQDVKPRRERDKT